MTLRLWLNQYAPRTLPPDFTTIDKLDTLLCTHGGAATMVLPGGTAVRRESGRLTIGAPRLLLPTMPPVRIKVPGTTILPGRGLIVKATLGRGFRKKREEPGLWPAVATLSQRQWRRRVLIARSWRPGDRMRPFGLNGSKKIQDIFCDTKPLRETRHSLPIFECGGEIVWIPGYRIAENWRVEGRSAPCLQLKVAPYRSGGCYAHCKK